MKSKKSALLLSFTSLLLCFAMLAGSTFAWFTDTATTGVNKIVSGKLDVALEMKNPDYDSTVEGSKEWITAEGKTLDFVKAAGAEDEEILWEPNCIYKLPELRIVNNGNLALKYKVQITGIKGDAKLNEVIEWTIGDIGSTAEYTSLGVGASKEFTIQGHMKADAGNDYQGLTIEGASITVYATQDTVEYDSFNNTYDADAGKDTAFYSLAAFNALTEIPEGVKTVYVDLGGASLEGGLTVGSDGIADHYAYTEWNVDVAPEGYPVKTDIDNSTTHRGDDVRYIYSTGKPAINVILTGAVLGAKDTGTIGLTGKIALKVPDAANVTFSNVTFGEGQMTVSAWTETGVASMTVDHHIASVTFDKCTFKGNWLQNGAVNAGKLLIKDCTFEKYVNTKNANSSNPIWIQNLGKCDATVEGCTFNAIRPIKLWEGNASGTVTIKNNTFNMSNVEGATGEDAYKNVAIMFSTTNWKLGNVEVSGNTVTGVATAFICFYNETCPTMADGATFTVSGNTLNGAELSVKWKSNTEYKPDFVTVVE